MRIIAGIHKGRNIVSTKGQELRPTTGRTREALFSILSSGKFLHEQGSVLQGAQVADICCGMGALGLESLSRGAAHVVFVDRDIEHLYAVKSSAEIFGEADHITTVRADVNFLPAAPRVCDLVFLDPPYHKGLIEAAIKGLVNRGWLAAGALLVMEMDKRESCAVPQGFTLVDDRVYGKTRITILQWQ